MTGGRTVGVILARGGSERIPRKNLRLLAGVPLVGRAVDVLREARTVDRVIVSTDDREIAEVARRHGAEVPFLRPAELAGAATPAREALWDTVERLVAGGERADVVALHQPTSPCCTAADIEVAVARLRASDASRLVSVTAVREHPQWSGRLVDGRLEFLVPAAGRATRRQDLPPLYRLNGAIYVYRTEPLLARREEEEAPLAYVMPAERSVDLDDPLDWALAESLLRAGDADREPVRSADPEGARSRDRNR